MIRALIFLALWAASPASGQVGSVALYTEYQNPPALAVTHAMQEEVGALLAPNGLRFAWRSLPAYDNQTWTELAVVTFSGRCQVLLSADNSHLDNRLGWTHISEGVVLPFAEVDCDAVRAFVLKQLFGLPAEAREKVLGRALGRVMVHELLHVFAKTTHHSSQGVDQAAFTVKELLADRMILEDCEKDLPILHVSRMAAHGAIGGSPQAGRASFLRGGCASCHGAVGEGTRRGPVLRAAGHIVSTVMLAAKLTKSERKMCQRAQSLKVMPPSLTEEELSDVVSFLNETGQ